MRSTVIFDSRYLTYSILNNFNKDLVPRLRKNHYGTVPGREHRWFKYVRYYYSTQLMQVTLRYRLTKYREGDKAYILELQQLGK